MANVNLIKKPSLRLGLDLFVAAGVFMAVANDLSAQSVTNLIDAFNTNSYPQGSITNAPKGTTCVT